MKKDLFDSICGICNKPDGEDPKGHICELYCEDCGQSFGEEDADSTGTHLTCDEREEE